MYMVDPFIAYGELLYDSVNVLPQAFSAPWSFYELANMARGLQEDR